MRGIYVDLVRNLRDTVRARRQERLREVELTWSDHDLDNFRVFALGLQPAEMADVCYALADATALPLMELLADYAESNEDLRRIAFQSLGKTPMSNRLFISGRLLASNNPMIRASACDMLAGVGSAATDTLAEALHDPSSLVSTAAIRGLAKIGGRSAGEKIAGLMREGNPDITAQALNAMIKMEIPAVVFEEDALAVFRDVNQKNELRKTAARALASGKSLSGRAALLEVVAAGDDLDLRRAAAEALGSFSDPTVAQALIRAVASDTPQLSVVARQSLSRLDSGVKLAVFRNCFEGQDVRAAMVAAAFLGEMPEPEAEALLEDALAAPLPRPVFLAVAESLGKSGFPGAWDALKAKLAADHDPDDTVALLGALADAADETRLDEYASFIDLFPGGREAEFVLQRLTGFYRAGKRSRAAEAKALEAIDMGNRAMAVPAVEILAMSGEENIRRRLLSLIAEHEAVLPVRRVVRALLRNADHEVAPLFLNATPDTSALLPVAVQESEDLGAGGLDFLVNVAAWARKDLPGARDGLALAAALDAAELCRAIAVSPDRVFLLEAWTNLDERERFRNPPDWAHIFTGCTDADKLRILDIIDGLRDEYPLRAVAMLAFTDPGEQVQKRAVAIVKRLVAGAPDADAKGA